MNDTVTELGAFELVQRFRSRELSPLEVLTATLAQIADLDPELNAFCLVDETSATAAARAAETRWAQGRPLGDLDGIPVAIKDLVLTRDWPTRRGSRLIDPEQPWPDDAPAVERLRASGAVLVGKTTTPEFGWKAVTDSPLTGVTRNPTDPSRTSGGSSGGSAAAVAAQMVPLALGTDGAGSIRIPAAFCGVVGLKPTYGIVPAWPPSPFGAVAHLGPIARSCADAASFLAAVAGPHWRDPSSAPHRADDSEAHIHQLRIAYAPNFAGASPAGPVEQLVSAAVALLEDELDAELTRLDNVIEPTSALIGALFAAGAAQVVAGLDQSRRGELDPGLDALARRGAGLSAFDYLELLRQRQEVAIRLSSLLEEYDLLVTPTMPIVAFEADRDTPAGWPDAEWTSWTPYTHPFNLSQQPALTLPCGTHQGLPVGVQLVGRRFDDWRLLAVGSALEELLRGSPAGPTDPPWGASEIRPLD